jgi:hypothetical protein
VAAPPGTVGSWGTTGTGTAVPKKSNAGLLAGLVGFLVVAGGVVAALAWRGTHAEVENVTSADVSAGSSAPAPLATVTAAVPAPSTSHPASSALATPTMAAPEASTAPSAPPLVVPARPSITKPRPAASAPTAAPAPKRSELGGRL